jgi:hypothetical protein
VGLAQLIRFLVMELTHSDSKSTFDICVIFTTNYSFNGRRCFHRQRCALSDRLRKSQDQAGSVLVLIRIKCVYILIGMSAI